MQGVYVLGCQRDQLASEKRKLARQLRYAQHSARLTSLSKQYDFGMVFFAAMGAVSLILSDVNSSSDAWLFTTEFFVDAGRVWQCAERPKDGQPDGSYSTHFDGLNNFKKRVN
ncbi:hypothetical protein AM571_CH04039 [Rhizobium etli 8C-3]|uniref:Uncharacterized protein n=2 Tax=Rhizobium TaxID=379 RepID=A0A4R3QU30_9HYPH|nr:MULTISPECIES: hypothetical protein [Rhizobium]APO76817.1 hypothetical protein AM571_CH04039 [Rhizobium etli 8C-3]TCU23782.1 hypothetical protein EV130_107137 [Rhizobium azibense]TCU36051.1 hypothetical protein EV129_108138 [Rhizobium azibense]